MWTKFGLKLQKNLRCGRPGGGGGGGVVSDFGHPRTRGGGGVKKGQIFADVLYGWPHIKFLARDHDQFSFPMIAFDYNFSIIALQGMGKRF